MRIRSGLLLAALLLLPAAALPQISFGNMPKASSLVKLSVETGKTTSGRIEGVVIASIQDGWHINSAHPLDEYAIPTVLELSAPSLKVERIDYPPHVEREFRFAGGSKLAVYEGDIRIPFVASTTATAPGSLTAKLRYQACNDNVCLPPTQVLTTIALASAAAPNAAAPPHAESSTAPGAGGSSTPAPEQPRAESAPAAAPGASPAASSAGFTPLAQGSRSGGTRASLFGGDLGATFAARGLLLTLLVVFVAGLALNLTPCVYPLIPITLAFFSAQSGERKLQRVGLSSVYVLGLAATYSALGVFSALSGRMFGAWLQSPAVLVFFALLMVALAASMFGLYEIRVPHFIADRAGARSGYAGALSMGLLVGVVAAPCVGPFVISLIALVGQKGSPMLGFLLFFFLALGLGVPYLVLGFFSSALSSIPRSGAWMDHVKKAMGFVLIAMAFYFLRPVTGDRVYTAGVALSLILGALFLAFTGGKESASRAQAVRYTAAAILLAGGVVFAIPTGRGTQMEWARYDEAAVQAALAGGKPVLIDFYADWCLPCKELDAKTFSDPSVSAEATRFARFKADLTSADDPRAKALSERYRIIGVPTVVFLHPTGRELDQLRLTGFETPEKFAARLKNVSAQ